MGEKYYKPIMKKGDHLVSSKDNPNRVRGLSRDKNNKNPDIPEWEEVDEEELIESLRDDYYEFNHYNEYDDYDNYQYTNRLTPEEEKIAQAIGEVLAAATISLVKSTVVPWVKESAWPWIKSTGKKVKSKIRIKKRKTNKTKQPTQIVATSKLSNASEISTDIDIQLEETYSSISEEEIKAHLLNIIYHMFAIVREIQAITNARVKKDSETDEEYLEAKKQSEYFLLSKVKLNLDNLLSKNSQNIDMDLAKNIFNLTGGGIYIGDEYAPVEIEKIKYSISNNTH